MVADGIGFKAAIVGRDATSSALLTRALTRNLGCGTTIARASSLLRIIASMKIDIAIISADIGLKVGAGFNLAQKISRLYPDLPILMLVDEPSDDATIRGFRSGARGIFSSKMPMSQLLDCVKHVRRGYIWVGPHETAFLLDLVRGIPAQQPPEDSDLAALTNREFKVVQSAGNGKTNKAIAAELDLSEQIVKNCLSCAFEKLGVSRRSELPSHLQQYGHSLTELAAKKSKTFHSPRGQRNPRVHPRWQFEA